MYIPTHYRVDDRENINAFIHAYGFATVITEQGDRPWGSHLPVLFDEAGGVLSG